MKFNFHNKSASKSRRLNIITLLLVFFVASANCSAVMAMSGSDMGHPEVVTAQSHCEMLSSDNYAQDQSHQACGENHCPETSEFRNQTNNLQQFNADDVDLSDNLLAILPATRAPPAGEQYDCQSAEYATTPLFYQLCVLRL